MEKIQQALERAKRQRSESDGNVNSSKNEFEDNEEIVYTHTKSMEGALDVQRENRLLNAMEHSDYADAFKILSTHVMQRMLENQWESLIVTSVGNNEGKTTTTINLGISIAKEIGFTVLVVDGDLRRPNLHRYFGINPELGLSDYLQSDIDLTDVLIRPGGIDDFVVLPGGGALLNSSEMLSSPKMCSLVKELKERYPRRIILFDMPPILNVADTVSFAPCVDAALIVVEDDVTNQIELKRAVELMSVTNVIGTVLNKVKY